MSVRAIRRPSSGVLVLALELIVMAGALGLAARQVWPSIMPDRLEEAAARTAQIATQYATLHDNDFDELLFPIARGIAGQRPGACGVVVSGVGQSKAGRMVVLWQKAQGTCAASRVGRVGEVALVPGVDSLSPGVVVEVASLVDGVRREATARAGTVAPVRRGDTRW